MAVPNYPYPPGGRTLKPLPRVGRSDNIQDFYMTTKTLEDKVRNLPEFQGANEQEMQGYIQNEINRWHTDRVGLKADYGNDPVNRAADAFDGRSA